MGTTRASCLTRERPPSPRPPNLLLNLHQLPHLSQPLHQLLHLFLPQWSRLQNLRQRKILQRSEFINLLNNEVNMKQTFFYVCVLCYTTYIQSIYFNSFPCP